jgi:hypothetical protein
LTRAALTATEAQLQPLLHCLLTYILCKSAGLRPDYSYICPFSVEHLARGAHIKALSNCLSGHHCLTAPPPMFAACLQEPQSHWGSRLMTLLWTAGSSDGSRP